MRRIILDFLFVGALVVVHPIMAENNYRESFEAVCAVNHVTATQHIAGVLTQEKIANCPSDGYLFCGRRCDWFAIGCTKRCDGNVTCGVGCDEELDACYNTCNQVNGGC